MNASSPLSDQTIFYGKRVTENNPISDEEYQRLLGLNPTLGEEIKRHVKEVLFTDLQELQKTDLNDNSNIISESAIEQAKKDLIVALESLEALTQNSQSIIVIADDCFTNTRLLVLLKNILGKENYRRFVKVVQIDYDDEVDTAQLGNHLNTNHALYLLGGSLSDTYSMHKSHYESPLAEMIKTISDEYAPHYINKRLVGICFGQQYAANIIGKSRNSAGIIATLKGPAQFAPSTCTLQALEYVKPIYRQALNGLSNSSTNEKFTSAFTRSGYVSFDLLKTEWKLGVIPLIKDDATGGIVGWGSGNGNIMGVQFHPELSFVTKKYNTTKNIRKIAPALSPIPEEQARLVNNFDVGQLIQRDIGEAFYVYTMLACIRDITERYHQILSSFGENNTTNLTVEYDEAVGRLVDIISQRVNLTLQNPISGRSTKMVTEWIDAVDREGRLLLNHQLDWKVSRSIGEISEILGITSIVDLIQAHKNIQQSGNYIVRDLGAGDGSTLKELYERLSKQDIIFYGVGDYIYFDLFTALKNSKYKDEIEQEILILFVEKVVKEFRSQKGVSTISKIRKALKMATFSKNDTIRNSSMTNNKTLMFSSEHEHSLSQEIQDHFEVHLEKLEELKKFVDENIYSLFSNFIQKIYVSQFNDLRIKDKVISKIDFQYSIRSTSHVSGREYMNIISEYIYNSAKPGSIFIDNGVHESYTSIPRLKELYEVHEEMVGVNFQLIYDKKTNYFCSVIITANAEFSEKFWKPYLKDDFLIVPLKEAYKATFFQLEYFLRNFIISNFKNNIVFWNFNTQIIDTLKSIMEKLKEENTQAIPQIILDLINHIANDDEFKKKGVAYNSINMSILENYTLNGESLSTILGRKVYTPEWMNVDAKRNY